MAANHIKFDQTTEIGRKVARGLQLLREGRQVLTEVREALIQTRDGDGSDAAHYDLTASLVGYQAGDYASANAAAKASFDELDSLHAKVTATATGDVTGAALTQACAKHGL